MKIVIEIKHPDLETIKQRIAPLLEEAQSCKQSSLPAFIRLQIESDDEGLFERIHDALGRDEWSNQNGIFKKTG